MLRIKYDNDRNIQVKFYYYVKIIKVICGKSYIEQERRCTEVRVIFPNENSEFSGLSVCNPADNFNKSIGRKLALTDAMINFDRSIRRVIWKEYHKHCK